MHINKLKLNDRIYDTWHKRHLKKSITKSIKMEDCNIKVVESVRNIGAMFDSEIKMDVQVRHVCSTAWHMLHNIDKVRHYLTLDQTKMVVHAYVTSKLDHNNTLLCGIPKLLSNRLQLVQNGAAKLITRKKKFDHGTPLLEELHWLPVEYRMILKMCPVILLTWDWQMCLQEKGKISHSNLGTIHAILQKTLQCLLSQILRKRWPVIHDLVMYRHAIYRTRFVSIVFSSLYNAFHHNV